MGGTAKFSIIPCTVIPGDQGVDAAPQANEDSGEHGHGCGGRAYGRQGKGTGKMTNYRKVCHVEENLQNV